MKYCNVNDKISLLCEFILSLSQNANIVDYVTAHI